MGKFKFKDSFKGFLFSFICHMDYKLRALFYIQNKCKQFSISTIFYVCYAMSVFRGKIGHLFTENVFHEVIYKYLFQT